MLHSIAHRLNTFLLVLLVLMVASLIAIMASRAGAGPLDPPTAPGPTLPQVEPRMPIPPVGWNGIFPIFIGQPGSYFLTKNLTGVSATNGIEVNADDVTIDLNGFDLRGVPGSVSGITSFFPHNNLAVTNGTIDSWGQTGISVESTCNGQYEHLRLYSNGGGGIRAGESSIIRNVIAKSNLQHGILLNSSWCSTDAGGLIEDSTAAYNGMDGIQVLGLAVVTGNNAYGNGGAGIHIYHGNNRVDSNNVVFNVVAGVLADVAAGENIVVRNSACGNGLDPSWDFRDSTGGANDFGPQAHASAATSPWTNIHC